MADVETITDRLKTPWEGFATLVDLLQARARAQGDREAYRFLVDGKEAGPRLSYGELDARARAIAAALLAEGAQGQRALLLHPSGLEFVSAFCGCLYAGVVAVPAYPPTSPRTRSRLRAIVSDAQPTFALTTSRELPRLPGSGSAGAGARPGPVAGQELSLSQRRRFDGPTGGRF